MSEHASSRAAAVDLDHYPLHDHASDDYRALVERCRSDLRRDGLFDLPAFAPPAAIERALDAVRPLIDHHSFTHRRRHNIYFLPEVPGLAADHPALTMMETSNRTVCADQLHDTVLMELYLWAPLRAFLAEVLETPPLHLMEDPLASVNVMSYRHGEALNWHFDRSRFTTTLLLQAPEDGGEFEYRVGLRHDGTTDHDAVGRLVTGVDDQVHRRRIEPGTLSVFTGHDTAHRVAPALGPVDRVVAVFSYFPEPGVTFSDSERLGFYGRSR